MNRTWKNILCVGGMIAAGCAAALTSQDVIIEQSPMRWDVPEYEMPWEDDFDNDFDFDFDFHEDHDQDMPGRDEIEEYFERFENQSYRDRGREFYTYDFRVNKSAVVLLVEEGLIFVALLVWMIASKANWLGWQEVWHPRKEKLPPTPETAGTKPVVVEEKTEVKPDLPVAEGPIEAEEITVVEEAEADTSEENKTEKE